MQIYMLFLVPLLLGAKPDDGVLASRTSESKLYPPEEELEVLKIQLKNLHHVLQSEKLFEKPTAGTNKATAAQYFKLGEEKFRARELQAAIHYLTLYVREAQNPESGFFLRAQWMLGMCYENLGEQGQAANSYLRFLSASITAPREPGMDVVETIRRLLPMLSGAEPGLVTVLTPLVKMDLPPKEKAELLYLSALAIAKTKRFDVAARWMNEATSITSDRRLIAGANLHRGEWLLFQKKYNEAKNAFNKVLTFKDPSAKDFQDEAKLGLARLHVLEKEPSLALKFYSEVPEDSLRFHEALFEKAYVLVDRKLYNEARAAAAAYLKRFPEGPEAPMMVSLAGYLAMKTGDLPAAKTELAALEKRIVGLMGWMQRRFQKAGSLNYRGLYELSARVNGLLPVSRWHARSEKLFSGMGRLNDRLALTRSQIRGAVFTMAQTSGADLYPAQYQRFNQLRESTDTALAIGNRLITLERILIAGRLTPSDGAALESSAQRRAAAHSRAATLLSSKGDWQTFVKIMASEQSLLKQYRRLKTQQAELAAMLYRAHSRRSRKDAQRVGDLIVSSQKVEANLVRGLELIRARAAARLPGFGPYTSYQKAVNHYLVGLTEERAITTPYRDKAESPQQLDLYDELDQVWRQWDDILKGLYQQLASARQNWKTAVDNRLSDLQQAITTHDHLVASLNQLHSRLEETLKTHSLHFINDYLKQLEEARARSRKWNNDLEWLAYGQLRDRNQDAQKQIDLERQILNDNLRNLEQGATLPWRN